MTDMNLRDTSTLTVANMIRDQLGRMAFAMMGASMLSGDHRSLQFRIKGSPKVNSIRIVLDPSDTYTVQFWRLRGINAKLVSEFSDIYADSLRRLIEKETGLYLSL